MVLLVVPQFIAKLEAKDWLTLTLSSLALLITLRSYFQRVSENRHTLRKQLTEVLEKLTDLNTERAKFNSLSKQEGYPINYTGLLNDQRRFFVRQAGYLAEQIPELVSPYECLVIAGAFADIEQVDAAEQWFQKACIEQSSAIDRAIAIRGYGRFLFIQGRIEEGRAQFQLARKIVTGDSDSAITFRANTLERLAGLEEEWSRHSDAKELLEKAREEFGALKNPARQHQEIKKIDAKLAVYKPKQTNDTANPARSADATAAQP